MAPRVPAIDNGTVARAASVGTKRRRNSSTTISTRPMVISSVIWTSFTLARMVLVRSEIIVTRISGGSQDSSCGRAARTPSAVAITLAPASLVMSIRMAGCVPSQAASLLLAVPLNTCARSPSRTNAPLWDLIVRSAYCAAWFICPDRRSVTDCADPCRLPVAPFTLAPRSTFTTSCPLNPAALIAAGSSCTRTAGFSAPLMLTWPTPSTCARRCPRIVSAAS